MRQEMSQMGVIKDSTSHKLSLGTKSVEFEASGRLETPSRGGEACPTDGQV